MNRILFYLLFEHQYPVGKGRINAMLSVISCKDFPISLHTIVISFTSLNIERANPDKIGTDITVEETETYRQQ